MKVLVTGATGFIGQNLIDALIDLDYEVHCIVRANSDVSVLNSSVKIYRHSGEIECLQNYFKQEQFTGVIHLASLFLAAHQDKDIENLVDSNITFGVKLLEASVESNVQWFINTGTFWQHFENQAYNPVNLYAASKEAFEVMAKYYSQTSNMIFTTIKLNDTFGPNDTRNKVFNLWAKIAKSGEVLEMSEGEQIIDISYIKDVVKAYLLLIEHLMSENKKSFNERSFVVTNSEKMTLKELSLIFEEATNSKLHIKWGGRPYRDREVMQPFNKGEVVPTWKPQFDLKTAIQKTVGENIL